MKIALVKLSSIGDVIHTLPLAVRLKKRFPEGHLAWIVQEESLPLLQGHPSVDSFRIFPRRQGVRTVFSFLRGLRREGGFQLAVDAQGNMKSALVTWATGAKIRLGFHFRNCREPLNALATNRRLSFMNSGHVIDMYLEFSRFFEEKGEEVSFGLAFGESEVERVLADLRQRGFDPYAGTACFNIRPQTDVREWYLERYAKLADILCRKAGLQVILNAGPAHREAARTVFEQVREKGIFNLGGENTIRELGILYSVLALERSKGGKSFFLGCDSAPLHLAVAVGLPVVGLYGSQDPSRNGPYRGEGCVIDHIQELDCAPCRKKECRRRGEIRACMKRIRVEEVWEIIRHKVLRMA